MLLGIAALCTGGMSTAAARNIAPFTLTDQDGRARPMKYPRDKVSVFVVADQKGSSEIAGWIRATVSTLRNTH